jgi:hypothetical protein
MPTPQSPEHRAIRSIAHRWLAMEDLDVKLRDSSPSTAFEPTTVECSSMRAELSIQHDPSTTLSTHFRVVYAVRYERNFLQLSLTLRLANSISDSKHLEQFRKDSPPFSDEESRLRDSLQSYFVAANKPPPVDAMQPLLFNT